MNVVERFLTYVKMESTSDPLSLDAPSTPCQLVLAQALVKEMGEIGIQDAHVDEFGIVYGWIPATTDKPLPAVGFIAHMDTVADFCDGDIHPVITENYDGEDLELGDSGRVLSTKDFPHLKSLKGHPYYVGRDNRTWRR